MTMVDTSSGSESIRRKGKEAQIDMSVHKELFLILL